MLPRFSGLELSVVAGPTCKDGEILDIEKVSTRYKQYRIQKYRVAFVWWVDFNVSSVGNIFLAT